MAAETYPITGILVPSGDPIPTRKEITAWWNDTKYDREKSLFIRAEAAFQGLCVKEKLSYFQIAAIHAYPKVSWDGVPNDKNSDGFCVHNKVTFPTFHRVYMLLFEQILHENMVSIIKEWKEKGIFKDEPSEEELWRKAASQFRLPYWDWAKKQDYTGTFALPQIFTLNQVNILTPKGGKEQFDNPLVRFTNPSGKPMGDKEYMGDYAIPDDDEKGVLDCQPLPWSKCIGTSRYGILTDPDKPEPQPAWAHGINNWELANKAMKDPIRPKKATTSSLTEMVGRVLAPGMFKCWEAFASTIYVEKGRQKPGNEYLSLEYVHNIMHNTTGGLYMNEKTVGADDKHIGFKELGLGHMSDVPVAAFDPIFWFHHCNIDRLTAIWQELNENLWFNDPAGDDPCPTDWLKPFHTDKSGGQWTSTMTRNRKDLGYDYDDLVPAAGLDITKPEDKIKYLEQLRTHIDNLYPHTAKIVGGLPGVARDELFDDYILNVVYDRLALNGRAYAIVFYLEDMSVDPEQQHTHIGNVYTFSAPVASCPNCRKQQEQKLLSRAQIPLTTSLLEMSRVSAPGIGPLAAAAGGLDRETVAEVIKNQLKWQFVELGGKLRPATDFPNTAIKVQIGSGYAPDSTKNSWGFIPDKPTYGGYAELKTAAGDSLLGDDSDNAMNDLIPDDSGHK